jgi:hypothetical protein
MQARAWLVLIVVAAAGCETSEPPVEPQAAEEADEEDRESVFDPWVETIDRARGVQQTIDDAAAERRRQIEEAER